MMHRGFKMTDYEKYKEEFEQQWLQGTMEKHRWNQSKTAIALGMSRGTLRTKLKQYFGNKYIGTRDDV